MMGFTSHGCSYNEFNNGSLGVSGDADGSDGVTVITVAKKRNMQNKYTCYILKTRSGIEVFNNKHGVNYSAFLK